jgi:hypothetical protein
MINYEEIVNKIKQITICPNCLEPIFGRFNIYTSSITLLECEEGCYKFKSSDFYSDSILYQHIFYENSKIKIFYSKNQFLQSYYDPEFGYQSIILDNLYFDNSIPIKDFIINIKNKIKISKVFE